MCFVKCLTVCQQTVTVFAFICLFPCLSLYIGTGCKICCTLALWGESLTREFEQNGFVFNESCNGNVLIYDPRLPNRASFIDTLTIYNTWIRKALTDAMALFLSFTCPWKGWTLTPTPLMDRYKRCILCRRSREGAGRQETRIKQMKNVILHQELD